MKKQLDKDMAINLNTITNCISSKNSVFSSYSETAQKKIVMKIFEQVVLQNIETEEGLDAFVGRVILQTPGESRVGLPEDPAEAALISMLLADPEWKKKVPSRQELFPLLVAIFWKKDQRLFEIAKTWLQAKLEAAVEEVPSPEMRRIYMRNLLSYYPFFSPGKGDVIRLPMGPCNELVSYEVEPIELTPSCLTSPLMAYGLVPKEEEKSTSPLLLFKGTTYPTDEGFSLSMLTDVNPFAAVGSYAFHFFAKTRIEKWLKEKTVEGACKAEVMGESLGGALSLQTVSCFSKYIKSVHAFNSPAMTSLEVNKWNEGKKLLTGEIPEVNVYLQSHDPVSSFVGSCFAPDWKIHNVCAPIDDSFQAHAATYTAHKEAFVIPGDAKSLNLSLKRRVWVFFQNCLFLPLFFIGTVCLLLFALAQKTSRFAMSFFYDLQKQQNNPAL